MNGKMKLVAAIVLLLGVATAAVAQEGIRFEGKLYDYWNDVNDLVISGDYAYVAEHWGVATVDLSDDANPVIIGVYYDVDSPIHQVLLDRQVLYAASETGFYSIDVTHPARLEKIAFTPVSPAMGQFALHDSLLLACGESNWRRPHRELLSVFSILHFRHPVLLDTLAYDSLGVGYLAIQNRRAYIAGNRLSVVDLTDPRNVRILGSTNFGVGGPLVVRGNYAYINVGDLITLDISNPDSARYLERYSLAGYYPNSLKLIGSNLFLCNGGLAEFNLANPASPSLVREIGEFNSVAAGVHNGYAIVTGWNDRIYVFSGMNLHTLFQNRGAVDKVVLDGSTAYMTTDDGFIIADLTNPRSPQMIVGVPTWTHGLAIQDQLAYITSGSTLIIADVSDRRHPTEITSFQLPDYDEGGTIKVDGNVGYYRSINYGTEDNYLRILDISNPHQPENISFLELGYYSGNFAVNDRAAYVISEYEERDLLIADLTRLDRPTVNTQLRLRPDDPAKLQDICITGNTLFAAYDSSGLYTFDLDNPFSPQQSGGYIDPDGIGYEHLAWADDHLYATSRRGGLIVFDVSTPSEPNMIGHLMDSYGMGLMSASDSLLAVSTGASLRFYDVSGALPVRIESPGAPSTPLMLTAYPNPFNSSATVQFSNISHFPIALSLFDPQGRNLGEWSVSVGAGNGGRMVLNGDWLPSGTFYLRAGGVGVGSTIPLVHVR